MTADRRIMRAMWAAVVIVAGAAAVISWAHIRDLAVTHGGGPAPAVLLPVSVDGTIVASSLVMLHEARRRCRPPALAWIGLAGAVAATVAANVAYGARWGVTGALLWALPAAAFVVTVETAMSLVRRAAADAPAAAPVQLPPAVAGDVIAAARAAYAASVAGGNPLSGNALAGRFSISRRQAGDIIGDIRAGSNGHGPPQ